MKKTKIEVVGVDQVRASCSCGFRGLTFSAQSGLVAAITAANDELRDHKCPPKPKKAPKPRKKKVKDD